MVKEHFLSINSFTFLLFRSKLNKDFKEQVVWGSLVVFGISNSGFLSSASLYIAGLETVIIPKLAQRFAAVGRTARRSWRVHSNKILVLNLKYKIRREGRERLRTWRTEPPLLEQYSQMLMVNMISLSVQYHISFFLQLELSCS